jgi:Tfp pilus assembly protein PilF
MRNHNPAQARADLRRCLEIDPERASACNRLAWLYVTGPREFRDPDKALPLAEKATQKDPKTATYQNTLGVVHYRLGQYLQAVAALKRSFQESKGESGAFDLFFLAMCHARLGDSAQAEDYYRRAQDWVRERQGKLSAENSAELDAFQEEASALLNPSPKP